MSQIKFEGDLSGINTVQLDFISSVLEERGFKNEKVVLEAVGQSGDNYVANVKRIIVEKEGETFKMIAKVAPDQESARTITNTFLMFHNEDIMYTEVLPKFTQLEKGADIPENERLRYAACYGSYNKAPNEIILLEDLRESEFIMFDRFVSLTDDTVKLVLKNFASLHSLSYALKDQEPETFASVKRKLLNMWALMEKGPQAKMYFGSLENDMLELFDGNYKKLLKGTVSQLAPQAAKCAKVDGESNYSVIQQGDSWTNNIMFKLEGDKAKDCCMIDYQMSKESSPVADIHYMIFNCTDQATRSKHYHEWIDYYHTQLDQHLSNFRLKASMVYPRDQFDAELRRYGKLSLSTSILLASVLMREGANAKKFKSALEESSETSTKTENLIDAAKMSGLDEDTVLRFKTRVEGLLESFQKLGYI